MTVDQEQAVRPVIPLPDALTSPFWDGARSHALVIQRCNNCQRYQHMPEPVCANCLSFDLGYAQVSGMGTVYSYEIAMQAFHPWFADKLPFAIAVVELQEQPNLKMISNLVESPLDSISVGDHVEVTFTQLDDNFVLPVFRPSAASRT
ncbi:Zn-ribbon domain-containing OB-fold protein [Jatrophihabitans sp. DSM 45814]